MPHNTPQATHLQTGTEAAPRVLARLKERLWAALPWSAIVIAAVLIIPAARGYGYAVGLASGYFRAGDTFYRTVLVSGIVGVIIGAVVVVALCVMLWRSETFSHALPTQRAQDTNTLGAKPAENSAPDIGARESSPGKDKAASGRGADVAIVLFVCALLLLGALIPHFGDSDRHRAVMEAEPGSLHSLIGGQPVITAGSVAQTEGQRMRHIVADTGVRFTAEQVRALDSGESVEVVVPIDISASSGRNRVVLPAPAAVTCTAAPTYDSAHSPAAVSLPRIEVWCPLVTTKTREHDEGITIVVPPERVGYLVSSRQATIAR